MKKTFLIKQPPFSDKYRLLVDDISDSKNYGSTRDIDIIKYNLDLLPEEFKHNLEIHKLFSQKGLDYVFSIGRYITVLQSTKDLKVNEMTFFDYMDTIGKLELKPLLELKYSKEVTKNWFNVYDILLAEFSEESDLFELALVRLT